MQSFIHSTNFQWMVAISATLRTCHRNQQLAQCIESTILSWAASTALSIASLTKPQSRFAAISTAEPSGQAGGALLTCTFLWIRTTRLFSHRQAWSYGACAAVRNRSIRSNQNFLVLHKSRSPCWTKAKSSSDCVAYLRFFQWNAFCWLFRPW